MFFSSSYFYILSGYRVGLFKCVSLLFELENAEGVLFIVRLLPCSDIFPVLHKAVLFSPPSDDFQAIRIKRCMRRWAVAPSRETINTIHWNYSRVLPASIPVNDQFIDQFVACISIQEWSSCGGGPFAISKRRYALSIFCCCVFIYISLSLYEHFSHIAEELTPRLWGPSYWVYLSSILDLYTFIRNPKATR